MIKNSIYYWRNALGDTTIIEEYGDKIALLINGNYQAADLEKLKHYNIYSYRLNDSDRLLFTTIFRKNDHYLLVLGVVKNHDYQKSPFLRNRNVLKEFLEKHTDDLSAAIDASQFQPVQQFHIGEPAVLDADVTEAETITINPIPMDYYNRQFIELSAEQEQAFTAELPVLITGPAGSGKSCVLMTLLMNAYQKTLLHIDHSEDPDTADAVLKPLLYVCESPTLLTHMQHMWHNIYPDVSHDLVQFKTYHELVSLSPEAHEKTITSKEYFMQWYTQYIDNDKKIQKASGHPWFEIDKHIAWQEFGIHSIYTPDDYVKLGKKQSFLDTEEKKAWLSKAYQKYQEHLASTNQISTDFSRVSLQTDYRMVVVDETQDFCYQQLLNLSRLAEDNAIVYCMDSRQSLHDGQDKSHFFTRLLGANYQPIILPHMYRCAETIAHASVMLLARKERILGGVIDRNEQKIISQNTLQGDLLIIDHVSHDSWLHKAVKTVDFAIVTSKELLSEAKSVFQSMMVFSVDTIKGLEFDTVVLYKCFDKASVKEALKQDNAIAAPLPESSDITHRPGPRVDQQNKKFIAVFNELFTAMTRAKKTLVIYEDKDVQRHPAIASLFKEFITLQEQSCAASSCLIAESASLTPSSKQEWKKTAIKLHEQGHHQQAVDVLTQQGISFSDIEDILPHSLPTSSSSSSSIPATKKTPSAKKNAVHASKAEDKASKKAILDAENADWLHIVTSDFTKEALDFFVTEKNILRLLTFKMPTGNNVFTEIINSWEKTLVFTHFVDVYPDNLILPIIKTSVLYTPLAMEFFDIKNNPDTFYKKRALKNPAIFAFMLVMGMKNAVTSKRTKIINKIQENMLKVIKSQKETDPTLKIPAESLDPKAARSALLIGSLLAIHPHILQEKEIVDLLKTILLGHSYLHSAAFTEPLYFKYGYNQTFSVLQLLSLYNPLTKITFLYDFFEKNPILYQTISSHDLIAPTPSLLYLLLLQCPRASFALKLISTIFEKNPNIIQQIPIESWSIAQRHEPDIFANSAISGQDYSIIYLLTSNEYGQQLLLELLKKHYHDVFKHIPSQTWDNILPSSAGQDKNCSCIYWLTSYPTGRAILQLLIDKDADFIKKVHRDIWTLQVPFTQKSPLSLLQESQDATSRYLLMRLYSKVKLQSPDVNPMHSSSAPRPFFSMPSGSAQSFTLEPMIRHAEDEGGLEMMYRFTYD